MILILAKGKLTYYEEIKDQLHDTNNDDISKVDDISVDDFKDANEALENPCRMKWRVVMLTKLKLNLTTLKRKSLKRT